MQDRRDDVWGGVERTRGEVRELCVAMTVKLRYERRERDVHCGALLQKWHGWDEVSPASPVGLLSGTPCVSVEVPIEALYFPETAYRTFGTGTLHAAPGIRTGPGMGVFLGAGLVHTHSLRSSCAPTGAGGPAAVVGEID